MVSFTCSFCQDVVKKPKVCGHASTCGSTSFTCVDCMEVFNLETIKGHTACISETEKYQGKWRQRNTRSEMPHKNGDTNGKREPLRPPLPPMNLSSDSDDSDGEWVKEKKKNTATDRDDKSQNKDTNGSQQKRTRAEPASQHEVKTTPKDGERNGNVKRRCETLELPRAVTSADCIVPSFVLGTDVEIAEVAHWILEDAGQKSFDLRALSKLMVERYNSRIAKHVRFAIEAAVKNGKLGMVDGIVCAP